MLYYPFFNAPQPVLYQAVLYWDNLATVVAPGWETRISKAMLTVHDAGLYRPILPYYEFRPLELRSVKAQLEQALDAVPLDDLLPPGDEFDERASVLHLEKLDESLADLLRERRLVREVPSMPWRLIASPTLVHLTVSILADEIARQANDRDGLLSSTSLRPHTDQPLAHRLALAPVEGRPAAACWRVDIGSLLPVPTGQVDIGELLRFRNDHDEERRVMMRSIDDLMTGLAQGQHPQDVLARIKAELDEATTALHAAARAKWRGWGQRSIAAIVAGTGFDIGDHLGAHPNTLAAATLALATGAAVNIVTDSIRSDLPRAGGPARYRYLHSVRQQIGS